MKKLIVWAVVLFGGSYFGAKFYLHYRVSSDLDNMLLMVSPFAAVTYSGVSSTMGGTLSIDDIEVVVNGYRDPIRADKVSIITPGFWYLLGLKDAGIASGAGDVPDSLGFAIDGFDIATDSDVLRAVYRMSQTESGGAKEPDAAARCAGLDGYSPGALVDLGYDRLRINLYMGYDRSGNDMLVDINASVENMYDMNIAMTLAGGMSPKAVAVGAYRPTMSEGRLEYIDRSLEERTTRLCQRAGLSDDEVLEAKLDAFNAFGEESGIVFDEQIIEPYKEFLAGKSTFVMTARPHEPVNISQIGLYKPSDVPALLNLEASAY